MRTGVYVAIAAIAASGAVGVAGAGASSAAQEHVLHAPVAPTWQPSNNITIQTGDRVRWTFDPGGFHNVQSSGTWTQPIPDDDPRTNHPDVTSTFTAEGVYSFHCDAHPGAMDGTVTVEDEPVDPTPSPSPSPTPTPSPSPTPIPQPSGGTHPTTPPPSPGTDTVRPNVRSLKLTSLRRAVRVRFKLSEPATVTLRARRGRTVAADTRVQAGAGTHRVTLRSKRLKKGRYVVAVQARDAFGNRSRLATKRLALRR
jgi:plastocyanin